MLLNILLKNISKIIKNVKKCILLALLPKYVTIIIKERKLQVIIFNEDYGENT